MSSTSSRASGGFSLGLKRAGMRTVAFCEIDPYCQRVLAKHWPSVPCYPDVRELTGDHLRSDGIAVDLIAGGFPCQDLSVAGKGAGLDGERSGLWSEYARIIGEVRPRYVIVENVAALLGRGLSRVLGDLAALGFDAEWHCIPASAVGAPHRRDRVWIVAYPGCERGWSIWPESESDQSRADVHDQRCREDVAHADKPRLERWLSTSLSECLGEWTARTSSPLEDTTSAGWNGARAIRPETADGAGSLREPSRSDWWLVEPDVGRVAHGVPSRVHRLRALGNAVVPQIPEMIGRAIMKACAVRP
jgi:DNA (cytosine-5)-methyltransferase 1